MDDNYQEPKTPTLKNFSSRGSLSLIGRLSGYPTMELTLLSNLSVHPEGR